eukprot:3586193-Alexandrium_andersonii.AAC.1
MRSELELRGPKDKGLKFGPGSYRRARSATLLARSPNPPAKVGIDPKNKKNKGLKFGPASYRWALSATLLTR